jgi:hypothetical protein
MSEQPYFSISQRYILVAEIVIVMRAGVWNICYRGHKEFMSYSIRNDRDVQG